MRLVSLASLAVTTLYLIITPEAPCIECPLSWRETRGALPHPVGKDLSINTHMTRVGSTDVL